MSNRAVNVRVSPCERAASVRKSADGRDETKVGIIGEILHEINPNLTDDRLIDHHRPSPCFNIGFLDRCTGFIRTPRLEYQRSATPIRLLERPKRPSPCDLCANLAGDQDSFSLDARNNPYQGCTGAVFLDSESFFKVGSRTSLRGSGT
jgi:hypothetical protein